MHIIPYVVLGMVRFGSSWQARSQARARSGISGMAPLSSGALQQALRYHGAFLPRCRGAEAAPSPETMARASGLGVGLRWPSLCGVVRRQTGVTEFGANLGWRFAAFWSNGHGVFHGRLPLHFRGFWAACGICLC